MPRRSVARWREVVAAYALMAPAVVLVLGVLAYPLGWEIWISLPDFSSRPTSGLTFVGFANYPRMLDDRDFWRGLATEHAQDVHHDRSERSSRTDPGVHA